MKKHYDYENIWRPFVFPESEAHFATIGELEDTFATIDLTEPCYSAAGIPLAVSGNHAVVNDFTENTLVYGETGSKKTRCVIRPLIYTLAGKRESMIVTDPKGELATDPKVRGLLDAKGYRTVFLDFRSFSSDGYNILEYAYELYRRGDVDRAMEYAARIVHALGAKSEGTSADPFWQSASEQILIPLLHILMDVFADKRNGHENINILSLASAMSTEEIDSLMWTIDSYCTEKNSSIAMFMGIASGADKRTLGNVIASASALLQPFLLQPAMTRMLSQTTFDLEAMYDRPTAVFLITPDETSAYDNITGLLIDNFYSRLIDTFTRLYQNRRSPRCRINFVCDEFCNLRINDMGPKISACRSREIRFTLVCQSMKQLEETYPDAAIIEGNCKNILFLQSSDIGLMEYVSELCGMTSVTESGTPERLVTPGMLRHLKKEQDYKEALFVRDHIVYFARLPDCDAYVLVKPYAKDEPAPIPERVHSEPRCITPKGLLTRIERGKLPAPFSKKREVKTAQEPEKPLTYTDELYNKMFRKWKDNA